MAKKNSFFVKEMDVPFYKVYPVFRCESPVYVQMIFEMAEVSFYSIGGIWWY